MLKKCFLKKSLFNILRITNKIIMDDKRRQFGNRFLTNPEKVFEHNAWDNVEWDSDQETEAQTKVEKNSQNKVSPEQQEKYENDANQFWDDFYKQHQNKFFKDRHWLFTEFPELAQGGKPTETSCVGTQAVETESDVTSEGASVNGASNHKSDVDTPTTSCMENFPGKSKSIRFFEVGCGVGNTVFPVLKTNINPGLFMYCCDLSSSAIQLVKEHPDYTEERCHAFVCDVTDPEAQLPFPESSLDLVVLIFVLSAVHPDKMQATLNRLARCLKPGGKILFRDYGRYDLAQLRFKNGQCLSDNFYIRGDGTRVYFFTQEEMRSKFIAAGLVEEQNLVDRRLQVNRVRQLKMYRVWIQCKYIKPL